MEAEDHLRELVALFERLRKVSHQTQVLDAIVTIRLAATMYQGVSEDSFDTSTDCIAFQDGVFCFR